MERSWIEDRKKRPKTGQQVKLDFAIKNDSDWFIGAGPAFGRRKPKLT